MNTEDARMRPSENESDLPRKPGKAHPSGSMAEGARALFWGKNKQGEYAGSTAKRVCGKNKVEKHSEEKRST